MTGFTIDRDAFAEAITKAAQGLSNHPAQPVLSQIMIITRPVTGMITLVCSDGFITFEISAPAVTGDAGGFGVPGKMLEGISKYFAKADVTVMFDHDQGMATFTSGRSEFRLNAISGDEYPFRPKDIPALGLTDGGEFAAAVRAVVPSASRANPVLQGLRMETADADRLHVVATDYSRMAVMAPQFELFDSPQKERAPLAVLVPAKAMDRFARVCGDGPVQIGWDDGQAQALAGKVKMTAPTLQGEFPPWRKVFSRFPDKTVAFETAELLRAVRIAQLVSDNFDLGLDGGGLHVRALGMNAEKVYENVEASWDGEPATFNVGCQLFADGLAGCGQYAELGTGRALFLRSGGFSYMVQPRSRQEAA